MKKATPIFDAVYFVCDVETTGLSPVFNRITEIAIVKIENGEITDKFSSLINPQQHIPAGITTLTGIRNEDVINAPTFDEALPSISAFLNSDYDRKVFTGHNVLFDYKFVNESFKRAEFKSNINFDILCTCKLARRLLKKLKSKSLVNVADHLEINQHSFHRALDDANATAKILLKFLDKLYNDFEFEYLEEVIKFQNSKIYSETSKNPALKKTGMSLKDFPRSPGVYKFFNKNDELIYIGKAKDLRERISSYFRHNSEKNYKLEKILKYVNKIEFEVTASELSALILESKLIKKEKPRFNSALKRYRFHPFLKLDVQNNYPKIEKVYEIENDGANYYGPFSSGLTVNRILKEVNENFKLRKCEFKNLKPTDNHSTCMYFEMGKCNAPCNFTESLSEYRKSVDNVHRYITSENGYSIESVYEKLMNKLSEDMEFEKAAYIRDRLNDVKRVMSFQRVITSAINDKKIIIKLDSGDTREFFFIHNGKLMQTFTVIKNDDVSQLNILDYLSETTEYLFFSLSKFIKHKFTPGELDEIKVISNWLAQNRERNSVLEITESHSRENILRFISE
ncbi:MAG TPA: exonuclease domain-containing protein [Ignavibacteria bacterium]|nr:exonuclease domain-containing protein [Ignavibacteria bacterium]